jgi:Zn-dependent protease with chaperone function
VKIVFLVAALLPVLCLAAGTKVEESGDDLLGMRQESLLRSVAALTIPSRSDVNRDRDANLIVTLGAAYSDVLLIAKPEKAAKELAEDFAKSVEGTPLAGETVEYSSEEGYAVVAQHISKGSFGKLSSDNALPIGDVTQRLQALNWNVGFVVVTPKYIPHDSTNGLPYIELTKWNYYAALKPVPGAVVHARASVPGLGNASFYVFLCMPPIVTLLSLLIAFGFSSIRSIPVERRRKLYPKLAVWPTFAVIGLHIPFAMYFLMSKAYRPYADLWFGSSSASSMMPFLLVPLPFIMVMVPISSAVETKLFGRKPDVTAPSRPQISEEEKALVKRMSTLKTVPLFVFLGILVVTEFMPKSMSSLKILLLLAGFPLLLGRSLFGIGVARQLSKFNRPSEDPDLEARARFLAEKMCTTFKKLRIDGTALGRQHAFARVTANETVTVSARALDIFDADELDSLVAHELAHLKLGHLKYRKLLIYGVFGSFALMFLSMLITIFSHVALMPPMLFFPVLILIPLTIFVSRSQRARQKEFDADRLAMETTLNPAALQSMLEKLMATSATPFIHENETASTHPSIPNRIAAIKEWAAAHGQASE